MTFRKRQLTGVLTLVLPSMAAVILVTGCTKSDDNSEVQFLQRRVDTLEKRVDELERRGSGRAPMVSETIRRDEFPSDSKSSLGAFPSEDGGDREPSGSSLGDSTDRTNVLLLKVKQIQLASRSDLPELMSKLGLAAPELDQHLQAIDTLDSERKRLLVNKSPADPEVQVLDEEIEKIKYRLELTAEEARARLIRQAKEISSQVESGAGNTGGTPESGTLPSRLGAP